MFRSSDGASSAEKRKTGTVENRLSRFKNASIRNGQSLLAKALVTVFTDPLLIFQLFASIGIGKIIIGVIIADQYHAVFIGQPAVIGSVRQRPGAGIVGIYHADGHPYEAGDAPIDIGAAQVLKAGAGGIDHGFPTLIIPIHGFFNHRRHTAVAAAVARGSGEDNRRIRAVRNAVTCVKIFTCFQIVVHKGIDGNLIACIAHGDHGGNTLAARRKIRKLGKNRHIGQHPLPCLIDRCAGGAGRGDRGRGGRLFGAFAGVASVGG